MNIALIEDEKILSSKLAKKLKPLGYNVRIFNDIKSFVDLSNYNFDIYIIDVLLTDGLGFSLLEKIRKINHDNSSIIMISGLDLLQNKIFGLNLGADDFLTKPFSPDELIARINAISRRINKKIDISNNLVYKNITYIYDSGKILKNGEEIEILPKERQIVEYFIRNTGKLIKRVDLINDIWGEFDDNFVSDNNLNVTLCRIRKKLGNEFSLETIHGEGFILRD